MKTHLYKMECITNMHVGSGDVNYNVIDNEVQKDPVLTDVPTIHASSLKGAIKEHFENRWGKEDARIKNIFGSKDDSGSHKFFSAHLIARPLRVSDGSGKPYVLTTDRSILENFAHFLENLPNFEGKKFYTWKEPQEPENGKQFFVSPGAKITKIEGEEAKPLKESYGIDGLIGKGEPFALAKTLSLLEYPLPVIARNVLDEKGISENVWFEEVVPYKSIFYFVVMSPDEDKSLGALNNEVVQFGANASIGYGYAKITEVEES
jgi:CRISPR-associated protein Cmr4